MYQLFDAVEVYQATPDGERTLPVILHIGKTIDGKVVIQPVYGVQHEVFMAVSDEYDMGQAEQTLVDLNNHLLTNPHPCKRFQCDKCQGGGGGPARNINMEPCKLDREADRVAVSGVEMVEAKAFYGYQPRKTKFVKFKLTRAYYASYVLRSFLEKKHLDPLLPPSKGGGLYELNANAVESYTNQLGGRCAFNWFGESGQPALNPPPDTVDAPWKALIWDIETPTENRTRFPRAEEGIEVASIAYECFPEGRQVCMVVKGKQTREVSRHPELSEQVELQIFATEEEMLRQFYRAFMRYDPDYVVGFNSNTFDFPYVVTRMKLLKMREWNQWSRVRGLPTHLLKTEFHSEQKGTRDKVVIHCPGRVFFDVGVAVANDIMIKCPSKKLGAVGKYLGLGGKVDLHHTELYAHFHGTAEERGKFIYYNMEDVILTRKIMVQKMMIPNLMGYCKVMKIYPKDSQDRGISYHINRLVYSRTYGEYLRPYIGYVKRKNPETGVEESVRGIPTVMANVPQEMTLRETGIEGAYVKDPTPGVYHKYVGTLDFKSLYPSLIQRHNICHSTWIPSKERAEECGLVEGEDYDVAPNGAMFLKREKQVGFFAELAAFLVNQRTKIRDQIKRETDPVVIRTLEAIANAYKIAANSVYGQLGMAQSQLALMLAGDAVTSWARSYITNVMNYVETVGELQPFAPRVRYGDTDSCMVQYNAPEGLEQARQILIFMQESVNVRSGLLQPPMEMGCDSLNTMFAISSKKKYMFVQVQMKPGASAEPYPVVKGLDIIKGDSVPYVRVVGKQLTHGIAVLEWKQEEIYNFMREAIRKMMLGEVELEQFLMTTKMSKQLQEYEGIQGNHLTAARQMRQAGMHVPAGDAIEYYFCHNTTGVDTSKVSSCVIAKALFDPERDRLHYDIYRERFLSTFSSLLEILIGTDALDVLYHYDPRFKTIHDMFGEAAPRVKRYRVAEPMTAAKKRAKIDASKHFDLMGFLKKK